MEISAAIYAFICLTVTVWIIIYALHLRPKKSNPELPRFGTFIINHSDPTKDLCQLALEHDLDEIEKHRVMLIEIVVNGDIATEEPGDVPKSK